ncbi:cysteine proteinase [Meredithblackwellia eburnea MCA 4105]
MSSAPIPDTEDRPLSDLNDHEIAERTRTLLDSLANTRPLVGELEPLQSLSDEYVGAETFLKKIDSLGKEGWNGVRRLRGDGDCFYRAFAFAYVERLLDQPPTAAKKALDKVESLLPLLDQAGYAQDIYDDFYDPLRFLLQSLSPSAPSTESRPTPLSLHTSFNDPSTSNSIVVFLRLLTSAFLKANSDDFVPFLFGLEDDPRFFESGAPSMEEFCSFYVEAANKEADHIQITALTRALSINTQIAYLDQSGFGGGGFDTGGGGGGVDFHQFESESDEKLKCALLYRPGHFDCLYR